MAKLKLKVSDAGETADAPGAPVVQTYRSFRLLSDLFKNGKAMKAGAVVELEEETGARFVASGDAEEIK